MEAVTLGESGARSRGGMLAYWRTPRWRRRARPPSRVRTSSGRVTARRLTAPPRTPCAHELASAPGTGTGGHRRGREGRGPDALQRRMRRRRQARSPSTSPSTRSSARACARRACQGRSPRSPSRRADRCGSPDRPSTWTSSSANGEASGAIDINDDAGDKPRARGRSAREGGRRPARGGARQAAPRGADRASARGGRPRVAPRPTATSEARFRFCCHMARPIS